MNRLFSKIYGCEAAGTIGNSMGDVTEGFTYKEIDEKFGFVETLLGQDKSAAHKKMDGLGYDLIYHAHHRTPGMTEDGQERHRLCASAIIKKGGRIDIVDLAKTWVTDINTDMFGYLLGPQDQCIYYSLRAGVPPWEVGRYAAWPSFIGTTKMIMPVGMVNACNPDQAAQDAFDLGRIKDVRGVPGNYALEVCAGIAAATAEALKPNPSVDGIIEASMAYLSDTPRKEVSENLERAKNADSWKDLRPYYDEKYMGKNISNAVEILSGALGCFYLAGGNPREAIIYSVNLGRDTDCKAYLAGGLAGALRGIEHLPADWVKTIEEQVVNDPYSVSKRTAKETAEGLYKAAVSTIEKMRESVSLFDSMI